MAKTLWSFGHSECNRVKSIGCSECNIKILSFGHSECNGVKGKSLLNEENNLTPIEKGGKK